MAARGFSITIRAVDQASAQFEKINKAIERIQAPVRRLQASLQRFASASGLTRVAKSMGDLARGAYGAFQSLTRIIAPLSAITSAASAAGLYRLVSTWGQFGSELKFSAQRIGVTSDQLQSLQGAAMLAGSSSGALTSGLTNLQDTMTDALGGRNPEAFMLLRLLHVNFQRTRLTAKNVMEVLPQIVERIKALKNPTLQARAATILFGGAAEDLLPLFREGSAGLTRYTQMARDFGVTTDQGTDAARALAQSQVAVNLAVEGLGNSIAQTVAPVLTPMLNHLASWIASNRKIISSKVAEYVRQFGTWLGSIDWAKVETGMGNFASGVNHVVNLFGGWKVAAEGLLGFMAGRWALGILAPIAKVTAALTRVVLLSAAAGGGVMGKLARGILGRGLTGAALDVAALPLLGAGIGFTVGGAKIGKDDTLVMPPVDSALEGLIRQEAKRQNVDPDRMVALARRERGGTLDNPIVSPAGAIGPMQLMPGTAAEMGVDPWVGSQNVRGAITYYKRLLARYRGNNDLAEAAYNAGPGRVDEFLAGKASLPSETQHYVASIDATRGVLGYKSGAPVQPVKVQVELTHANKPPPGFRARVKNVPTIGHAMASAAEAAG